MIVLLDTQYFSYLFMIVTVIVVFMSLRSNKKAAQAENSICKVNKEYRRGIL